MFAKKKIIAVLALVMLPVLTCQASWMRQEGEVAASVGVAVSEVGEFFDRAGTLTRNMCGTGVGIPMSVEYGASYYRTFYGSTSLHTYSCPGVGSVSGFTDFELGMRGRMDVFKSDHTWELAAIVPNYITPQGGVRRPKNWGLKMGIHSSNRVDPYLSFIAGDESSKYGQIDVISYGAGVKLWEGHLPNELFAYLGWGHTLSVSQWSQDIGGWDFSAKLDAQTTFGKEHTVVPGLLILDAHDKSELLTAQAGFAHSLTKVSSVHFSLTKGLRGRNASSPFGINVGYSKAWRD